MSVCYSYCVGCVTVLIAAFMPLTRRNTKTPQSVRILRPLKESIRYTVHVYIYIIHYHHACYL